MSRKKFNTIIYLFSSLMIIGMFTVHTKSMLNISGAISVILTIIGRYLYKDFKFSYIFKNIFIKKDALTISANLFLIWLAFVSLFLSLYPGLAIADFFRKTHYLFFFIIISLSLIATDKRYKYWLLTCLKIIPAFTIAILFSWVCIELIQNDSIYSSIRKYQEPLNILLPFLILQILSSKKWRLLLTSITITATIFVYAYAGSRGSLGTLFTQIIIILFFYGINKNTTSKSKKIIYITIIVIASISTLKIAKEKIPSFQNRINQGLNSSGRDQIIKTRLPLFIKYGSITHGIGYGPRTYQRFLKDTKAPNILGAPNSKNKKEFHYWNDEPQLMKTFYESGVIGLSLYLIFLGAMSIKMFMIGIKNETNSYIAIAILTSFIGHAFTNALFYNSGIIVPLFLYSTWLILNYETKTKPKNLNIQDENTLIT